MTTGWRERALKLVLAEKTKQEKRKDFEIKKPLIAEDFCAGLAEPDDPEERDKALDHLQLFLPTLTDWSEVTIRKFWKGLWMCHWHSDRPLVQTSNAQLISRLIRVVKREPEPTLRIGKPFLWFAGFWNEAIEEWPQLDFHRLNKYFTLARFMLCAGFQLIQEPTTSPRDFVFFERTLAMVMNSEVKGLAFQLCDIWIDEADRACLPIDLFTRTLGIFFNALTFKSMSTPTFLQRMMDNVFDTERLEAKNYDVDRKAIRRMLVAAKKKCRARHTPATWTSKVFSFLSPPSETKKPVPQEQDYATKYGLLNVDKKTRRKEQKAFKKAKKTGTLKTFLKESKKSKKKKGLIREKKQLKKAVKNKGITPWHQATL
jgi:hypothetical protein